METEVSQQQQEILKRMNKAQKKFKKLGTSIGLKQLEGVERIVFRTKTDAVFYIDGPVVLESRPGEYAVSGEFKSLNLDKEGLKAKLKQMGEAQG